MAANRENRKTKSHARAQASPEGYLSFSEAAEALETTFAGIRNLVAANRLEVFRDKLDGRKKLLRVSDVEALTSDSARVVPL